MECKLVLTPDQEKPLSYRVKSPINLKEVSAFFPLFVMSFHLLVLCLIN